VCRFATGTLARIVSEDLVAWPLGPAAHGSTQVARLAPHGTLEYSSFNQLKGCAPQLHPVTCITTRCGAGDVLKWYIDTTTSHGGVMSLSVPVHFSYIQSAIVLTRHRASLSLSLLVKGLCCSVPTHRWQAAHVLHLLRSIPLSIINFSTISGRVMFVWDAL
jgi:hypothetical protein